MTHEHTVTAAYLLDGYAKGSNRGLTGWYRDLTVAEAKRLGYGNVVYAVDKTSRVRKCRLNGDSKVWKRSPGCELSLKYGLREYFRVGGKERLESEPVSAPWQVRIVVPVREEFLPDTPAEIVSDWVLEKELVEGRATMPRKPPTPRQCSYFGLPIRNTIFPDGTWLEGEEFCYPSEGMKRRAYALCKDGQKRLFKAGIPDTYFTIPAVGEGVKGCLSIDETGLKFTETKK